MGAFESLRRLSEAATPGEWSSWDEKLILGHQKYVGDMIGQTFGRRAQSNADAAFIVAAVNYVRSLLKEPAALSGNPETESER